MYNYQRLKRQYSILLNGIVPKNREQFLAFKETGSFRLFLCRVSASKRGVGGISESFGSNFFCLFHGLGSMDSMQMIYLLLKTNSNSHLKH